MRKNRIAPRGRKHRQASHLQHSVLIAEGKVAHRSATVRSALDNRSHRTTLRFSCEGRRRYIAEVQANGGNLEAPFSGS